MVVTARQPDSLEIEALNGTSLTVLKRGEDIWLVVERKDYAIATILSPDDFNEIVTLFTSP